MLAHGLPRHFQVLAQLSERLAVVLPEPVQQQTAARVGQRLEDSVHLVIRHLDIMQVFTCVMSNVQVVARSPVDLGVSRLG